MGGSWEVVKSNREENYEFSMLGSTTSMDR